MFSTQLPYGVEELVPITQQMRYEISRVRSPVAVRKAVPVKKKRKTAETGRLTTSAEGVEAQARIREQAKEKAAAIMEERRTKAAELERRRSNTEHQPTALPSTQSRRQPTRPKPVSIRTKKAAAAMAGIEAVAIAEQT